MMFTVFDVFASFFSALQTCLPRVQSLSFSVTTHNSTLSKANGATEDILNPSQGIIFITQKELQKLCVITSTCLATQEVLEYHLRYASILRFQKPYQAHLANRTKHDYLVLYNLV